MFDLSLYIDLPLVLAFIIAFAIFMYVLLDGFDLGIGILFPFAPSDKCRDTLMNSVSPFWDGNETWLVLGGGALFSAFPLAYSILLPAFYIPITVMLFCLIVRGISFEFRFKSVRRLRYFWDYAFHFSSLGATFFQGSILGAFILGLKIEGRNFSGDPFDWLTSFSMMTGIALVFGYALLGSTWLIMKTNNITQEWSRKVALYVLIFIGIFMILVSVVIPFINDQIKSFWFSLPNLYYLIIIPLFTISLFIILWYKINTKNDYYPFIISIMIFLMGYLGLVISIYPWIIPFKYTIWEASASNPSLSLMLTGLTIILPIILMYTGYVYYIFRGKADDKHLY